MTTSNGRKRLLIGASAIAAAAALAPRAEAATMYVGTNAADQVYQFPNAGYAGSVVTATAGNDFVSLSTGPTAVAVDSSGNVVVSTYNATQQGYAFSPSGTSIGTSAAFGNSNFAEVIFNNNLYVTSYTAVTSGDAIVELSYSPSGNNSASFGSPTTLATGSSTNHGYGLTLDPANGSTNNDNYLFFTYGSGTTNGVINAMNLSNGNVLSTPTTVASAIMRGVVYDPHNGYIYADTYDNGGAGSGGIYQFIPNYSNGTLTSLSASQVTLTNDILTIPDGMAFGPDGNLYIADQSDYIDEVNIDGNGTGTQGQVNEYVALGAPAFSVAFTPEPASLSLLALGAGGLLARRRRPVSA